MDAWVSISLTESARMIFGIALAAVLANAEPVMAHRTVSTTQPLAQQRFDTGLTEMYAFDGPDAAVDFDGAALTDPHLAMAFWGKALAEGSDLNNALSADRFARAQDDAQKAVALESYASADERELIAAAAQRYAGSYADAAHDEDAYESMMRTYVTNHPEDGDAAMLLVEALLESHGMHWTDSGVPDGDVSSEILVLVRRTLARQPENLMANHLCIHVYDTAPIRTFAVQCAQRLDAMTFGPGEEHLAHMPAHLWIEIGDGERALASSERAWALHPTYYALHDADVAFRAALVAGDRSAALKWAERLASVSPYFHLQAVIDARTGDWGDIPALKVPQDRFQLVDGLAAVRSGDISRARNDERALQHLHLPSDAALLQARLDESAGNVNGAVALLRPLARSQRDAAEVMPYFPADEALGALCYRTGRYADAHAAFAAILTVRPDDPRALFGIWQTSLALHDTASAQRYSEAFHRYWAGAPLSMTDF
jgi:tetratricopeptide (TPR) repeat protein